MSITVTTDVFCDGCSDWVFGTTGPRPDRRRARIEARKKGWWCHNGTDLCPKCRLSDSSRSDD